MLCRFRNFGLRRPSGFSPEWQNAQVQGEQRLWKEGCIHIGALCGEG